MTVTRIAYTLA